MFGVLDRYIGRTILSTILITLFTLVSLSGIIKFVDQLRKTRANYDALSAALYTLLSTPKDIEIFFPMAALLGALLGLGALASRSELVVMEASGFTRMQIAAAVMKTAIPLVLVTMLIGEWVAPTGEQAARNMRAEKLYGRSLLATQGGLWAKDGSDFIYISYVDTNDDLIGVNIYHFNDQNKLLYIRYAARAEFDKEAKQWTLLQIEESNLSNPQQVISSRQFSLKWQSSLTPDKLGIVAMNPESLSASGLYKYVHYLKITGQKSSNYELLFWGKIFKPLSVAVMMLMALSFIFGPLRSVPMGIRIVVGISFGFIFYLLDQIFGKLIMVYNIPAILGAIIPSLLFLIISIYLLKRRMIS